MNDFNLLLLVTSLLILITLIFKRPPVTTPGACITTQPVTRCLGTRARPVYIKPGMRSGLRDPWWL